MAKKKSDIDFAKAFAELEQIASWFEEGEPDLDEGMKRYERASELAKELKAKLDEAENRIKEIKSQH
jgi:exodeoxyribonuclease VII small subunit